ncbi:MAG: lysylphosphatidylglycerol synthase transmembrane domain-containing protein [Pirellulales bacterium]
MQLTKPRVVSDLRLSGLWDGLIAIWRWPGTKIILAAAMLAAIGTAADWNMVGQALWQLDPAWLAAAMFMFIPQTLLSAMRWRRVVQDLLPISFRQSLLQVLFTSSLNLIVPGKLGDLSKGAILPTDRSVIKKAGTLRAMAEKVADVIALGTFMLYGCLRYDGLAIPIAIGTLLAAGFLWILMSDLPRNSQYARSLAGYSLLLWALHLLQIDFFLKAAGVFVSPQVVMAKVPLAILAGLLPLSACGIGTRDTALIWLFSDVAASPTMAVVGMLTALRYLVPGLAGMLAFAWHSSPSEEVDDINDEQEIVISEVVHMDDLPVGTVVLLDIHPEREVRQTKKRRKKKAKGKR